MRKIAFLKKKSIVVDFDDIPSTDVVEYYLMASFNGAPYENRMFPTFDGLIEYIRQHESYGLDYKIVMRATMEYPAMISFDGEIPF